MSRLHEGASSLRVDAVELRYARICSAIVAAIFLASLVGIEYATTDDIWQEAWVRSGDWFATGQQLAAAHGRLFKPSSIALFVPYIIDSPAYFTLTYLGPILLAAILAAKLMRLALPIAGIGSFFVLLFFGFAQNSFDCNLFSAIPFVWESAWVTLLLSALILARAIEKESMWIACMGATIYLLGMIEAFVPYAPLLVVMAHFANGGLRKNGRYVLPYLIGLALWLLAWLWWRHIHPSHYPGSTLSAEFSPSRIAKTVWVYAIGGAPFATLWNDSVVATAATFKEGFKLAWLIKAMAVALGLVLLARLIQGQSKRPVTWNHFIIVSILIPLPVALLGLTPQYQDWVQIGSRAYAYSHFSYFAWIALLIFILIQLIQRFRSRIFLAILAVLGGVGSIVTDWSNYETNFQQKLSARKWETFEVFLASRAYAQVPEGSRVRYLGLDRARGIAVTDQRYWTYYSRVKKEKSVEFISGIDGSGLDGMPTYTLMFSDEPRGYNQSILFARNQTGRTDASVTREFSVVINTRNDSAAISGSLPECAKVACTSRFTINGTAMPIVSSGRFSLPLETSIGEASEFSIKVDSDVDILSLGVTFDRLR
jgi:hypothetical protein